MSRVVEECGHEVIVANSRKLRLIYENPSKDDRVDALYLARVARVEPALLSPIKHRGATAQKDLALLRSRDALVCARTQLINHARGLVKSAGSRLPSCSSPSFPKKVSEKVPEFLRPGLLPVVEEIASLNDRIKEMEKQIEALCDAIYPETKLLRQIKGVGPITSLAFVLTLEVGSSEAYHQARRRLSEATAGQCRPLHPGTLWSRLGPAPLRFKNRFPRREDRQEESRRRGGPQAGRPASSPLAWGRSLRASLPG